MTTGYTQWPPLVAPRATYGGLQNDEQHSSAIARHIVTHKAEDAETNGPEHHSQRVSTASHARKQHLSPCFRLCSSRQL